MFTKYKYQHDPIKKVINEAEYAQLVLDMSK